MGPDTCAARVTEKVQTTLDRGESSEPSANSWRCARKTPMYELRTRDRTVAPTTVAPCDAIIEFEIEYFRGDFLRTSRIISNRLLRGRGAAASPALVSSPNQLFDLYIRSETVTVVVARGIYSQLVSLGPRTEKPISLHAQFFSEIYSTPTSISYLGRAKENGNASAPSYAKNASFL